MEAKTHTSAFEESAMIERIARIVFSVRGAKPDYARLARELEQVIPFDIFGVVLLRHDRQAARVTVCQREEDTWVARLHQLPLRDSMLERVLQEPVIRIREYPDGLDEPPAACGDALSNYHHLRSTLIAPLMVDDHTLGALELGSTVLNAYADQNVLRLMSAFGRVLGAAIESVQLEGSAAIQNRQRQALKDVTSALTETKDLSTVLGHIVTGVSNALSVSSFLFLQDRHSGHHGHHGPDGNRLRLIACSGLEQELLTEIFQSPDKLDERSILWQALRSRQPLESSDLLNDDRYSESEILLSQLGLRSLYCYPLMTGSTIYGALVLCSLETGGFTPLKTDILTLFASQATAAIHNDILLEAARQRSRFQQAVEQLELDLGFEEGDLAPELEREQLELLRQVRRELLRTYGIPFHMLLKQISSKLPTTRERETQTLIDALQDGEFASVASQNEYSLALPGSIDELELEQQLQVTSAANVTLLEQTAVSALRNSAMLGELSRLITQLKQSTNWLTDAWFVVDVDGVCRYMNPAAQRLCGVKLESMAPSYSHDLWGLQQGQALALHLKDVFARLLPRIRNEAEVSGYLTAFTCESDSVAEIRCILAEQVVNSEQESASDHHYKFTRYPLYIQQGGQLEANALQIQDVTEQVRDEKNRSALFSAVSHDLRTPLTTIKAAVTGLLEPGMAWGEQDRREVLEEIESEADHLTVMVTSLVELSRIEVGAFELKKEWCDLAEIFYTMLPRVKRLLANRELHTQFQEDLPLIYVDHVHIGNVLFNLIENAARHSPDHSAITTTMDVFMEDGAEKLRVQVIDHGVCIPEHEREQIFTAFHTHEQTYGNGLPLTICKRIIDTHQGSMWVEPTEGGGSCFVFTLPVHVQPIMHTGGKVPAHIESGIGSKEWEK